MKQGIWDRIIQGSQQNQYQWEEPFKTTWYMFTSLANVLCNFIIFSLLDIKHANQVIFQEIPFPRSEFCYAWNRLCCAVFNDCFGSYCIFLKDQSIQNRLRLIWHRAIDQCFPSSSVLAASSMFYSLPSKSICVFFNQLIFCLPFLGFFWLSALFCTLFSPPCTRPSCRSIPSVETFFFW